MNILKVALNLIKQGKYKLATEVIDLNKRRKQLDRIKEENKRIIDEMKREKKLESIYQQHEKEDLSPESLELTYPNPKIQDKSKSRYIVEVRYPNFDNEGDPYFDDSSVSETLSVTEEELDGLKQEHELGYLELKSIKTKLSKARDY
jgi:hypothetical protein